MFEAFSPDLLDPITQNKRISKDYFWRNFGISKQTISTWKKALRSGTCNGKRLKLNYALFFALLLESSFERALCFMSVAGYPFKVVPDNHSQSNNTITRCFNALAYVYKHIAKESMDETDSDKARLQRLLLADDYINSYDPDLIDVIS